MSQVISKSLARLLTTPKYEVIPMKNVEATFTFIPRDANVSVTVSPTKGLSATLELTRQLSNLVRPENITPHISARLLESEAQLRTILHSFEDLGIQELFLVGGDTQPPRGPFANSYDLVQGVRSVNSTFRLGVAAYPEGHPNIPDETLLEDLKRKQPYVQFMSTQLCFDAGVIKNWLESVRNAGVTLPVQIGIAGAVDVIKLTQIATRIGVGDSLRYLTKHAGQVFKLVTGYKPDDLVNALTPLYDDPFCDITGFHVYTFNQLEKTEHWRQQTLSRLLTAKATS
jgi:methylenetetrahydrofolate reductase (NADPH)